MSYTDSYQNNQIETDSNLSDPNRNNFEKYMYHLILVSVMYF